MIPLLDAFFCSVINLNSVEFRIDDFFLSPLRSLLEVAGKKIHKFDIDIGATTNASRNRFSIQENGLLDSSTYAKFFNFLQLFQIMPAIVLPESIIDSIIRNDARIKKLSDNLDANRIYRIICIGLNILLVIPCTCIGSLFKIYKIRKDHHRIMFEVLLNHQKLKHSMKTFKAKPLLICGPSSNNEFTTDVVFPCFSLKEIHEIRLVSKSFYKQIAYGNVRPTYLSYFNTHIPMNRNYSWIETYRFLRHNRFSDELTDLFGGIENYLRIPLIIYDMPFGHAVSQISELINSNDELIMKGALSKLPSVIRLQFDGVLKDKNVEYVLIKYTSFIPREQDGEEIDRVQHNYLILNVSHDDVVDGGDTEFDFLRVRDSRIVFCEKDKKGHPFLKDPNTPIVEAYNEDEFIEELLGNQSVGIFKKRIQSQRPAYIYKKNSTALFLSEKYFEKYRLFEDLPIMLGHVSLETMLSLFVEKSVGHIKVQTLKKK